MGAVADISHKGALRSLWCRSESIEDGSNLNLSNRTWPSLQKGEGGRLTNRGHHHHSIEETSVCGVSKRG